MVEIVPPKGTDIRKEIEGRTVFREKVSTSVEIPFSAETKRVLQFAAEEADRLGHNYIGTEHLLLGLIREGEGVAAQVLQKLGADLNRVRQTVIQLLSGYTGGKGEQVSAGGGGVGTSPATTGVCRLGGARSR